MREPAVIIRTRRTGETDTYGADLERDDRSPTRVAVFTDDSGENVDQANQQTESFKLSLPTGLGLTGTERIELRGHVFDLRGAPLEVRHQRTGEPLYARAYVWRSVG